MLDGKVAALYFVAACSQLANNFFCHKNFLCEIIGRETPGCDQYFLDIRHSLSVLS